MSGQPYGTLATNTTVKNIIITNQPSGEYFVLPPGQCGWSFVYPQPSGYPFPNVVVTSNVVTTATNAAGFVGSQSIVTYFTNHTYIVQPINCASVTPPPNLYQGIGRVQFVEADYDSLLGQYWQPVTNNYTMTLVTNSQAVVQQFQRVVTAPDFLFDAADLVTGPGAIPIIGEFARNLNFDTTHVLPGLAGPGTITPATTVTFNRSGPVYFNETVFYDVMNGTPYFTELPGSDLTDLFYAGYFIWASYDGTTNAPVVYPDGTSIANLENQVLVQLTPATLPDGYSSDGGESYGPRDHHRERRRFHPALHLVGIGIAAGFDPHFQFRLDGDPFRHADAGGHV